MMVAGVGARWKGRRKGGGERRMGEATMGS